MRDGFETDALIFHKSDKDKPILLTFKIFIKYSLKMASFSFKYKLFNSKCNLSFLKTKQWIKKGQ